MAQVGSTQSQYYRHDYAKVCMTGLLGCRWHRYKQSTKASRKVSKITNRKLNDFRKITTATCRAHRILFTNAKVNECYSL